MERPLAGRERLRKGGAQVAAVAGFETVVYDASADQVAKCQATHEKLLARAVEKERMTREEADALLANAPPQEPESFEAPAAPEVDEPPVFEPVPAAMAFRSAPAQK